MTTRHLGRLLPVCVLLLANSLHSIAQDRPARANIVISLSVTDREGATRIRATSADDIQIGIGESRAAWFYGSFDGKSGGMGYGLLTSPPEPGRTYWQVRVQVVSIELDSVSFELDWQRMVSADDKRQVAGDRRIIKLQQGARHVLDYVPVAAADSKITNAIVEVQAAPIEDPAVAGIKLDYDLWLEEQNAGGARTNRRVVLTGLQGEKVPYKFDPVSIRLDTQPGSDDHSPFKLNINGSIVGRLAQDGAIQVALSTRQIVSAQGGGGGYGGTKSFSLKEGETISVELPIQKGRITGVLAAGVNIVSPKAGVAISDGGHVTVDLEQYYTGTKVSLILTVRRKTD